MRKRAGTRTYPVLARNAAVKYWGLGRMSIDGSVLSEIQLRARLGARTSPVAGLGVRISG